MNDFFNLGPDDVANAIDVYRPLGGGILEPSAPVVAQ